MKPNKSGTVLMYNCSGPEYSKLRQVFAMLRIRMRPVQPDRYHLTLNELALGEGEAVENAAQAIEERMLVFYGMNQAFLAQVLEVIRLSKLPEIEFKAVVTTENQNWTSVQLLEHLKEEKQKIEAQEYLNCAS